MIAHLYNLLEEIVKQLIICVFVLGFSSIFGREKTLPEPRQIVSFAQLDSALINELIAGTHPDMAIEFQPGTEIPLRFFHRDSLFSLSFVPNLAIKVEKLCYLRFMKKKVYISQDLVKWEKPDLFRERPTTELLLDSAGLLVQTTAVEETDVCGEFED